MKKIFILLIVLLSMSKPVYSMSEIIEEQASNLNIYEVIQESNKYTKEVYNDLDMKEILGSAITGKVDNSKLIQIIGKLFGNELKNTINLIGSILIIIVIHAIIRSITDGLENKGVGEITYYVQYILIIAITMTNFASIINSVKDSVSNLTMFINSLIPILISLLITTGSIVSAGMLQPILLFIITFIGNTINGVIIPILLIGTVLGIVSKLSSKIQVDKLAKFVKSSIVWILGTVLTIFVSILSLEGNLTAGIDGVTAKTAKVAVSSFVPVVGKILR